MTVSICPGSAHRSLATVSFLDKSAHRSLGARDVAPSPWPRELGIQETQATEMLALMPEWSAVARRWWDPRPRITITVRARLMGGVRVYRFWTPPAARRRVERFLAAHRRIYRLYAQPSSVADATPPLATRSGGL